MMNENEIIKAEIPFYYVDFYSLLRPSTRVATHEHESHQIRSAAIRARGH